MSLRFLPGLTILSASLSGLYLAPVQAQSTSSSAAIERQAVDEIVVIGSRRQDVTALNSVVPVDVISSEQLEHSGYSDLARALRAMVPSFNYTETTTGGGVTANKGANLRGLASDQTLVLLNGKRRHAAAFVNNKPGVSRGSQSVDLSTIPISAIERVEVLRDGASAQYGSDAIAGVVNVVLKERESGGQADVKFGEFDGGGGFTRVISGWKGFSLPGNGFLTLSAEIRDIKDRDKFSGDDQRRYYFAGQTVEEANADRATQFRFYPLESRTFAANAESSLSDNVTLYGFSTYQWRYGKSGQGGVRPLEDTNFRGLYPDGHTFKVWNRSTDFDITTGLRIDGGNIGNFDLAANYGRNNLVFETTESNNPSYGFRSPTDFYSGTLRNEQFNLTLDYTRDLALETLYKPLTLSAGTFFRKDRYTILEGQEESWADGGERIPDGPNAGKLAPAGNDGFPGFSSDNANRLTRDVYGLYLGLEGEVLRNLQLGLAGRYEHYSDFGSTTTGKVSARYDFTPAIAFRTTFNTGFRAPTAGQLAYSNTQTTTLNDQRAWVSTFPVSYPAARVLGAQDLKPERSTNISFGFVLRPSSSSSVTIDAYQINVKDRITFSENLSGPAVRAALDSAGFYTVGGANFFTNGLDTRTRGVDVVGRQRLNLKSAGQVDLSLAYNWNKTRVTRIDQGLSNVDILGRAAVGVIEYGIPRDKLILGVDYRLDQFRATITSTLYGKYQSFHNTQPARDQSWGRQWVTDVDLSYDFGTLELGIGAINLFDQRPEYARPTADNGYVNSFAASPYNTEGAFYYVRAALHF